MIDKISVDIREVVSSPDFADKMKPLEVFPKSTTPQELQQMLLDETSRWSAIAKVANIKVD